MNTIKVSDYIINRLEKEVKHIFLIPGGGCIHLVDSLGKSNIKPICNLHEQASGISAEAYSQYTNNIGVALVTTGPGGTNIVTPIASAWLDSLPMLVLVGQVQRKDMKSNKGVRQLGFQEINLSNITSSITKFSHCVKQPDEIPYYLEKALYLAKNGRPGPVVLEIPLDVQSSVIDLDISPVYTPPVDDEANLQVSKIIEAINASKRPIILAGNGVRLSGALDKFKLFIEKTKIPTLLTWKALDFLEENHELYVGRPGGVASRGANFNQQNSDLIICLGARLDHGQLAYQSKFFAREAKKIIVDIDNAEIDKLGLNVDFSINNGCEVFLQALIDNIDKIKINTEDWLKFCKDLYEKYPICLNNYYEQKDYVNNYVFIEELSKILPENSLVVPGSSGACSEVTMQALKVKKGTRVFNSEGLGSMGFGVPAAIGACLASSHKTICIDGDGGFFMNFQELELIKRYNLPIILFILNNNGYGSIKSTQKNHFNNFLVASDPESGLTLPSISKTAKLFDIDYKLINNNKELISALPDIIKHNSSMIIELMIDPNHMTLPKASVYKTKDGLFATRPMEELQPFLPEEEFLSNMLVEKANCE
jgi:acetolactate synthase-1/2/3 large subunit